MRKTSENIVSKIKILVDIFDKIFGGRKYI